LGDVSSAIQICAEEAGFSVVREYTGHGIGRELHEDPRIPNFGTKGQGPRLPSGLTVALEPMINAGGWETETLSDEWTVVTKDRKRSVHFEHTVVVGRGQPEILT
jgi:methionyl aminopeptidase